MKLVGQAKKDFEKWVFENVKHYTTKKPKFGVNTMEFEFNSEFYILPPSMQYGVIVDWFDSVGIEIFVKGFKFPALDKKEYYFIITDSIMCHLNNHLENRTETRTQARQKAIERANEIYNNR